MIQVCQWFPQGIRQCGRHAAYVTRPGGFAAEPFPAGNVRCSGDIWRDQASGAVYSSTVRSDRIHRYHEGEIRGKKIYDLDALIKIKDAIKTAKDVFEALLW